jgi:hypothetical protein
MRVVIEGQETLIQSAFPAAHGCAAMLSHQSDRTWRDSETALTDRVLVFARDGNSSTYPRVRAKGDDI